MPGPRPIAVVDIGTNSTRLLIATIDEGRVTELDRRTTVTRLGQDVDRTGELAQEAIDRTLDTVAGYVEAIRRHDANPAIAIATSATRDAGNGAEFRAALETRFGLDTRVITGDEEARLTFAGATALVGTSGDPTLVFDIGGGSTEFVVGIPHTEGAPDFRVSTQAGVVRQTERHLHDDPPKHEQLETLADEVRSLISLHVPPGQRTRVKHAIAVAGTATSLAAIDQKLDPYDPAKVQGYRLNIGAVERHLAELAAVDVEARRRIAGLHPDRAPTIIAGTVIFLEAMRAFGLDELTISEADILHGAALDAAGAI